MSVSILVVDDEPDVAELFRQRFRREARQGTYVMHFASSGEDALSKLDDGVDPQLIVILSDINMPGMDGLTLLGEIKRRWPELPVMMVTAYGDDERRRRADECGAAEFITKPVDFEMLKERLRRLPNRLVHIIFEVEKGALPVWQPPKPPPHFDVAPYDVLLPFGELALVHRIPCARLRKIRKDR